MAVMTAISNEEIAQTLLAAPRGHSHLRLAITTRAGDTVVLQEAAVAAIVRAYTAIKTHPARRAVKMVSALVADRKKGYAKHQLIEADVPDEEAETEMTGLLGE